MQRTFIRDLGHYKAGQTENWPRDTWKQMLVSTVAKKAGYKSIEDFSRPVDDVAQAGAKTVRASAGGLNDGR